jgi:hypothetical protein
LLPLPVTWTVRLGAAVDYAAAEDEEAPAAAAVDAIADAVRARMQALIGELLSRRDSILRG